MAHDLSTHIRKRDLEEGIPAIDPMDQLEKLHPTTQGCHLMRLSGSNSLYVCVCVRLSLDIWLSSTRLGSTGIEKVVLPDPSKEIRRRPQLWPGDCPLPIFIYPGKFLARVMPVRKFGAAGALGPEELWSKRTR